MKPQHKPGHQAYPELNDELWLTIKHHIEELDAGQIAELLGCSPAGARNALIRFGVYNPKRRPRDIHVLGYIDAEQMLRDAAKASSWWKLGKMYQVQTCIVRDHAIRLGIFDQVPQHFDVRTPGVPRRPPHNEFLQSKDWIVATFCERYQLKDVAEDAGVKLHVLKRWMDYHQMTATQIRDGRNRSIAMDYQKGFRLKELSVNWRIDQAGIYRILREAGLDTSRHRSGSRSDSPPRRPRLADGEVAEEDAS